MVKTRPSERGAGELARAFAAVSRTGFEGPGQTKPRIAAMHVPMAPGFYLFPGGTGSGKTTLSLALALVIAESSRLALNFRYILEPRANPEVLERLVGPNSAGETKQLLVDAAAQGPYVVLDSVTYLIPALGKSLMGDQEDVTMKEGLRRSDILGVLRLDNICRENNITVIGTINSELFPRTDDLEGACEGSILIAAPNSGVLGIRDRLTRVRTTLVLPEEAIALARRLLGYTSSVKSDSSSSLLSRPL